MLKEAHAAKMAKRYGFCRPENCFQYFMAALPDPDRLDVDKFPDPESAQFSSVP